MNILAKGGSLSVGHEANNTQHGNADVLKPGDVLGEIGLLIIVVEDKFNVAVVEVLHKRVAGSFTITSDL